MKVVVQRVKNASVSINSELFSTINQGLLVLFGVEKDDKNESMLWLVKKLLNLRIFSDECGKMNKSIIDIQGEIMVVSQFTLAGDCKKGTRPSFDNAELPDKAMQMYQKFVAELKKSGLSVKTGEFGAMMDVKLCNDGPVTFILEK